MSFQWIINNAEQLSIDTQQVVGQTVSRNNTVRATSRGGGIWRFTVKLPDGLSWETYRGDISKTEALGRVTTANISLNSAGHDWLYKYQGNSVNSTGFVASITGGSTTITLTTSPTTSSGFKFKAGDFIQLGSTGKVYRVAADVAFNSNSVTLNRAVEETTATGVALRVGANCVWTVICTDFPQWTLTDRNQVSWSGPFVFYENRV
jgi:hypothetical protein